MLVFTRPLRMIPFSFLATIFVLARVACAESDDISALRIAVVKFNTKLEQLEDKHKIDITALSKEVNKLENDVEQLKVTNDELVKENERLRGYNNQTFHRMQLYQTKSRLLKPRNEGAMTSVENYYRRRQAAEVNHNIAFSAYMDRDDTTLTNLQTLIFNQQVLNEGGGYNKYSGFFTAPVSGVYSFSFFIGQRDTNEAWVALYVNDESKMSAASEGAHAQQDLQGGNVVNVKLSKNDKVQIKQIGNDPHIEGSSTLRLTSFSGFLIFPVDDEVKPVGK